MMKDNKKELNDIEDQNSLAVLTRTPENSLIKLEIPTNVGVDLPGVFQSPAVNFQRFSTPYPEVA